MKLDRRVLALLLALVMVVGMLPTVAFAEESGTWGSNITWVLDNNGVLTISGKGKMQGAAGFDRVSWDYCRKDIVSVVIEKGVTSIGQSAFLDCTSLESITIPESVTSIGNYAFSSCSALKNVYYTGSEEDWSKISIASNNNNLGNATKTYNYVIPTTPPSEGSNEITQNGGNNQTVVTYSGQGKESYTVTVPATMTPGETAEVSASGTWASNRKLVVSADSSVTLTNSIKDTDTKELAVTFGGITLKGSNTAEVSKAEDISVADISNALFGTWSGTITYSISMADC